MPRIGKESPRSLADLSPPPGNERQELPEDAFGRASTCTFNWDFSYARGRSLARKTQSIVVEGRQVHLYMVTIDSLLMIQMARRRSERSRVPSKSTLYGRRAYDV